MATNLPSSFSVEQFQNAQFEGAGDTRRVRIEPKEYVAQIQGPWGEKSKLRVEQGKDGASHLIADFVWQPDDPEQQQRLGIDKLPTIRQSVFLDLTPNGGLDMGPMKNGDLNRLREALGMNADGQRWSFPDFIGKVAKIKVTHRPNKDDPDNPYMNVSAVTKM